jgi:hypothetical protein
LVLRIFDLAPKGPDKSAQGIALGNYATPSGCPERAEQSEDPRDVVMLVNNPSDERFDRGSTELFRPFRAWNWVIDGFAPRAMPWADL